jgi:type IV pilus assembly protein PilY1
MKRTVARALCVLLTWMQLPGWGWAAVDIAQVPIDGSSNVKPNIIFAMDDSGSMDFEVMLNTNDGALWWQNSGTGGSAWDAAGKPLFNSTGTSSSTWYKLSYLFPNGCASDKRILCDNSDHFAIPPTAQFASLRSVSYNPLYYNPLTTYSAWPPGYISTSTRTFSAATATSVWSHPVRSSAGSINLTADIPSSASPTADTVFRLLPGMVIPGALIASIRVSANASGGTWTTMTQNFTVDSSNRCRPTASSSLTTCNYASIPYYAATYYQPEACTVDGSACVSAPDGATLKRYEIKSGVTFPSGRTYAAEMQNFANWFQYYRKRKLLLGAAMGNVLAGITNVRGGVTGFNVRPTNVTMYDFDATANASNDKAVIGQFYNNPSSGGTPTRQTLDFVGRQFSNNTNIIQYACQRNAAFIVTDGFGEAASTSPPTYNKATYGSPTPLGVPYAGTLGDLGLAYYTINPRPSFTTGRVPVDSTDTTPGADLNPNLHVNTYAITLGARGTLWPGITDPFATPPTWPNPNVARSPTAIDDLWLATLNGRGQMLLANDVSSLTQSVQDVINDILFKSGSQSAVGLVNPNVTYGSNTVYWSSYNGRGWTGDVNAGPIDLKTGAVSTTSNWSAATKLDARDWTTRKIASFNGSAGVPFTDAAVGASIGSSPGGTSAQLVSWLRGDRTQDGALYRKRVGRLGDIVNAEPVESPDGLVVYQASNDGMLHAFRASDGEELWAYVPSGVLSGLGALAAKIYSHRFFVDGTPSVQKLDTGKTILVGGLRAGGKGFYALDVTQTAASSDADVASKVLWEFPNASTSTTTRNNLGLAFSRPSIVKTAADGWVVLVSSGYNTAGDGRGRVFMLDAMTGQIKREFVTTEVADIGQVATFVTRSAATPIADAAYAGDLAGNLWRFNLETGAVTLVVTLKDAAGVAQPITATPELTMIKGQRVVLIGTGRLLGATDFSPTQTQSFYAISDTGTTISNVRTALDSRTLVVSGDNRTLSASTPDWTTRRGWYFDLPAGEVANTDPLIAQGGVFFTTNKPSSLACSSQSYIYMVDVASGSQRPPEVFTGSAWTGQLIGNVMSSRVVIAKLPTLSLVALVHESDNSIGSRLIRPPAVVNPRRAAWKEIQR